MPVNRLFALVVGIAALAACTVTRRSDSLMCKSTNDCNNGRVCDQGYCVVSTTPTCPSTCTSCMTGTPPVCVIQGGGGRAIDCPAGYACEITCTAGSGACGDITCNTDLCTVTCSGASSCGNIDCPSSCGCQVNCGTGACGTNTCPTGRMGNGCTTSGGVCTTNGPGCNSC